MNDYERNLKKSLQGLKRNIGADKFVLAGFSKMVPDSRLILAHLYVIEPLGERYLVPLTDIDCSVMDVNVLLSPKSG
jgi:hypothetical protein